MAVDVLAAPHKSRDGADEAGERRSVADSWRLQSPGGQVNRQTRQTRVQRAFNTLKTHHIKGVVRKKVNIDKLLLP